MLLRNFWALWDNIYECAFTVFDLLFIITCLYYDNVKPHEG
jgi:hypothetical protein